MTEHNDSDGGGLRVRTHRIYYRMIIYGIGIAMLSAVWAVIRLPMQRLDEFRSDPPFETQLLPEVQAGFTLVDTIYNWLPLFFLLALSAYLLWGAVLSDRRSV